MSSHLQSARAANRRARAREQDEAFSEDEVAETQASQSKRRKGKGRARDSDLDLDDDDDVVPMQTQGRKATQTQSAGATQGLTAFKKKVHDLVKLALYQEYRKQPLRKDDINKKVMERANAKVFNALFDEAQSILRMKFGMELVGLRPRVEEAAAANGANGDEVIAATQKKKSTAGAKAYILRSVLSSSLISLMTKPKPIAQDGSTARVDLAAPTGGEGDGKVDCGALVDWQKGDGGPTGGIALIGLLWVVLGTILVHDRTMLEDKIKLAFAERLDIHEHTVLPLLSRDQVKRQITFDDFLKNLVKQNYLEKVKIPGVNQGEELSELRWGPRADAEFGEQEVAEFMVDIMATREPIGVGSDDEEDARPVRGKRGRNGQNGNHANGAQKDRETPEQRRTKMMDDIKQAAGTELRPITKA
ncbi:hypothetical protein QFC24_004116 [Naganishia onofrii]|uniref:Uncharacterized protein n=1 Tax=Naganishia onofrii TaxID=1851511 RepID=A0ACC2XIZ6_9TREE|nr:hypothetical protein QFC24_004116 [Naganishia onofrii]